jgi:hypothetical protein
MATREERVREFAQGGGPPGDQRLELLCEDHNGTYVLPFPCRWSGGTWRNAISGHPIEAQVLGWRLRQAGIA